MWKNVPGLSGRYEVSTSGHVRHSLSKNLLRELNRNGYRWVYAGRALWAVHRLVVQTFQGPIPKGYHVNHKNGIRYDNRVRNLEAITPAANVADAHARRKKWLPKKIRLPVGQDYENGKRAILTTKEAACICNLKSSFTFRRWANKLNVGPAYQWGYMAMYFKNHAEAMAPHIEAYKKRCATFAVLSRNPISQ